MIRDTSSQDAVLTPAPARRIKRCAIWAGAAVAAVTGAALLLSAWRNSEHSVSAARLRIAEVTRGTLVRDASVNGRVVVAISPTLYSTARPSRSRPTRATPSTKAMCWQSSCRADSSSGWRSRALAGSPKLLLADEPTGNLDTQMARGVMELLEEINAQGTLMVTHDPELAVRSQRNVHIIDGQVSDLVRKAPSLFDAKAAGHVA